MFHFFFCTCINSSMNQHLCSMFGRFVIVHSEEIWFSGTLLNDLEDQKQENGSHPACEITNPSAIRHRESCSRDLSKLDLSPD